MLLAGVLILGAALRLTGFSRGFDGDTFHAFHPDEETVARAALELTSPFAPPLTAYGLLPVYLARGALAAGGVTPASFDPDPWPAYRALRLLAVVLSCATMVVVFLLGRRLFDRHTAILATLFIAAAPVAIQQGHFYTVDAVFLLLVTLALYGMVRVAGGGTWRSGVVVGLCVGLAAATRLNGLLLLPVAVAVVWLPRGVLTTSMRREGLLYPLTVVATTLAVVVLLQPYLLTSPELMWRDASSDDFWFSARIASGERLRFWSLYDHHTIRYWQHLAVLLPLGVGLPLTALSILGIARAARNWRSRQGALLLWAGLFFLVMGGLHTKHVRYLLPLLPVLVTLAAALCMDLWRISLSRWRQPARFVVAGVSLFTLAYGVAFARIYLVPDSRIEAMGWLHRHVAPGTTVGLEAGGFSLRSLVDTHRFDVRDMDVGRLLHLREFLSCGAAADHLASRLQPMEYVAIVDVNRHAQVVAAADVMPATASFYRALGDGRLGYRQVYHAKVAPGLLGQEFADDGAEPSFLGYDHPAVRVYQRQPGAAVAIQNWRNSVTGDACPDALLADAVTRAAAGDTDGALQDVQHMEIGARGAQVRWLLAADIYRRRGDEEGDRAAFEQYQNAYFGAEDAHLIPWATSLTMVDAGDPDLALTGLMAGVFHVSNHPTPTHIRRAMALSYQQAADQLQDKGQPAHARRAREMAADLDGLARAEGYR